MEGDPVCSPGSFLGDGVKVQPTLQRRAGGEPRVSIWAAAGGACSRRDTCQVSPPYDMADGPSSLGPGGRRSAAEMALYPTSSLAFKGNPPFGSRL